jgi:hypothetical protein
MEVDQFIIEKLLGGRERDYQNALRIARQYFAGLEGFIDSAEGSKAVTDDIMKRISEERSTARRGRRAVTSEPTYIFENDILNYAWGHGKGTLSSDINATEAVQRRASQPVPGTEAHHPASVSSTESLVQNMDEFETRKLWDIAKSKGYTIGSHADGYIPLSKPAHTTGGRNWGSDYAHVGTDGKTPDPGRFKTSALPKGTTAENAWPALQEILDEQRLLNERAYSHPMEKHMRGLVEKQVGPVEWRGPVTPNRAALNSKAKGMGVNATVITKSLDKAPKLMQSGLTPGVDVMTPVGARVPLGTKMPKPAVKPKPKPAAKPKPKPAVSKPDKPNRKQLSPSEQIRLLQNAVQDAIPIHPGMSLPSYSLIQGI